MSIFTKYLNLEISFLQTMRQIQNSVKPPGFTLGFMNLNLLDSNHRHFRQKITWFLSVERFRQIVISLSFSFSPPWRWPHEWSKHVDDYSVIKLQSQIRAHLLALFKNSVHFTAACGGAVFKALRYKPEGRGFDSRWCHWNFSVT
jgi:hypothetical protein